MHEYTLIRMTCYSNDLLLLSKTTTCYERKLLTERSAKMIEQQKLELLELALYDMTKRH